MRSQCTLPSTSAPGTPADAPGTVPPAYTIAGSYEVVLDGGKDAAAAGKDAAAAFDSQRRYVFGFVHHGLYPLGEWTAASWAGWGSYVGGRWKW